MNGSNADADGNNQVGGTHSGHVVQSRAIHGDVHFHAGAGEVPVSTAQAPPRQLPTSVRHFVNRAVEQDALTTLLNGANKNRANEDGAVLVSAIDGIGGVGKSTLAVHWAHHQQEHFPDGELYVDLHGFDPSAEPTPPADALATFLTALGIPTEQLPVTLDARAARFRSMLHDKRMLVVLDNATAAEQVRPLFPASSSCLVLITSRNRLDDLVMHEGAWRMTLDVLTRAEAIELLERYLGRDRLDAEPEAVDALIEHCAGLPLALGIAAVRAAQVPGSSLHSLVAELQDEQERLDVLDDQGRTGVRSVFSWSYRSLSPEAARLFRLLSLPSGPDIGLAAITALADTSRREVRRTLAELTRSSLLEQRTSSRYQFHDLLRAYAMECVHQDESAEEREAAVRRLLDFYLRTSHAASRQLVPVLHRLTDTDIEFRDDIEALNWWDTEHDNLISAIHNARQHGLDEFTWRIPHTLMHYFKLRNSSDEWVSSHEMAIEAARRLGNQPAEAKLISDLGGAYFIRKDWRSAIEMWEQSLPLLIATSDPVEEGAYVNLGYAYTNTGQYESAARAFAQALRRPRGSGTANLRGYLHGGLALLHSRLGKFDSSLRHHTISLTAYRESDEGGYGQAYVLNSLADLYARFELHEDAVKTYRQAVRIRKELGHRQGEAESLHNLGTAMHSLGDLAGAQESWKTAVTLFEELGDAEAEEVRERLASLEI